MAGRQSRGRQRIPMKLIESQDDLYATFSKRRRGLYKKASELSTLCGADVGIIIFSPTNNPFSFWHPTMESVIERYRNPNQPLDDHTRIIEANIRDRIEYLNRRLDEVLDEKEEIKEQEKQLNEIDKTREKVWWEQIPIENLNNEQVKEWKAWFEDLNSKVKNHIEELRNGASRATTVQQQNAPFFHGEAGPSTFPQEFPHGPSYAPTMGMIEPSQFHGQYYNVPPQAHLPFAGDGTSHIPDQHYRPLMAQYPSAGGGCGSSFLQFRGVFNSFPRQAQDPSTGGTGAGDGTSHVPDQHYPPPRAQYPSAGGDGTSHVPDQHYLPPRAQYPSAGGDGTSHVPDQHYPPPRAQYPSAGGDGTSHVPDQHYPPPRAQYPSAGGGGSGFLQFPGLFNYFPRQAQDPSTNGTRAGQPSTSRGVREPSTHARTGEADPSRRRDTNP